MTSVAGRDGDELERLDTADGSVTYRLAGTDVTYRSVHGARSEARHVFVEGSGLRRRPGPWRVLELGFGLGTSFAVTVEAAVEAGNALEYCSVERAPVPAECLDAGHPAAALAQRALDRLRAGESDVLEVDGPIRLRLLAAQWLDDWSCSKVHALYFDPFGPKVEPQSWTTACFERARAQLADDGVLSTYSAAGHVKRSMAAAGLYVASAPGPAFKRGITLASPSEHSLGGHAIVKRPAAAT